MSIGKVLFRNGERYTVYKINDFKIYAESEDKINIICIPNLKIVK